MPCVLMGSIPNTCSGPDFVSVYLDDVTCIVFLEEQYRPLAQDHTEGSRGRTKAKPVRHHFVLHQVEYLGHRVMPEGL